MTQDVARLVAAARAGDDAARQLVAAEAAELARPWARRLVDDRSAIEDVVQETVLDILQSLGELRHPEAFATWVRLTTRTHAGRYRRAERALPLVDLSELPDHIDREARDGPEQLAERAHDIAVVRRALAASRDDDRLLLDLRYRGEWTDRELTELLGISTGAVRKRLHDARRRLKEVLLTQPDFVPLRPAPIPKETTMTNLDELFGSVLQAVDIPELGDPPGQPEPSRGSLPTGIKVLDAVIPWPRGGTVDVRGPVGLGQLVLICEIVHNLGPDTGAVVALASTDPAGDGSSATLDKLVDSKAIPEQTIVIRTAPTDEHRALHGARTIALTLAAQGRNVLWLVDRTIWDHLGAGLFDGSVGVLPGGGSVTGVRVAPHARKAEPAPAWHEADAQTVFDIEPFVAGRLPAINVLASSSSLVERGLLPAATIDAAKSARRALERSATIQHYLTQPFWVAESHTGQPGIAVDPARAAAELADLIEK